MFQEFQFLPPSIPSATVPVLSIADELALSRSVASQVAIHSQPVSSNWPTSVTSSPFSLQGAHHHPDFLVYLDFLFIFPSHCHVIIYLRGQIIFSCVFIFILYIEQLLIYTKRLQIFSGYIHKMFIFAQKLQLIQEAGITYGNQEER